jgi:hypothetical protein
VREPLGPERSCELPPQPDGFEGPFSIHVQPNGGRLAPVHVPDHGDVPVDLEPAAAAPAVRVHQRHDLIAGVDELLGVPLKVRPDVPDLAVETSDSVVAVVCLGVEDPLGHVKPKRRATELDEALDVAAIEALMLPSHDLDVLVRNNASPHLGGHGFDRYALPQALELTH